MGPDGTYTVGASGVIFGWLAFLLVRGFFAGSVKQILLAAVLFMIWGGVLWGVLPSDPHISWQGHLFGALAGVLAAWLVARADRGRRQARGRRVATGRHSSLNVCRTGVVSIERMSSSSASGPVR